MSNQHDPIRSHSWPSNTNDSKEFAVVTQNEGLSGTGLGGHDHGEGIVSTHTDKDSYIYCKKVSSWEFVQVCHRYHDTGSDVTIFPGHTQTARAFETCATSTALRLVAV